MSRDILQSVINNFDLQRFRRFFSEKNKKFRPSEDNLDYYDDDNFSDGRKLGELYLEDGNLLICAFETKKDLTERSGKKAQYEMGKKILKETQTDAGIFLYYNQDGNLRFSLIYANYLGKKRDWSAFRRFTYFVGNDLTNKTFYQRIGDGDFSSLEKIKDAFSVEKVTKEFYEDIANWYFWAVQHSIFPKDAEVEENGRNIAVIRLITRMIFIWFMREKSLVPKNLFEEKSISAILEEFSPKSSTYYQAILQNLFFATLSTKKDERKFRSEIRGYKGYNPDFGNQNVYRYQEFFKNPENIKDYFGEIPFLNGGLFECLDDKPNGVYIDGFTAVKKNQPNVPNILFFSEEKKVDLNDAYGTKSKTYEVRGLINILSSFNFTIDENLPDDQDIALDPELLGRVFENLLASFNPETSTTARKSTGSYYTPREIVDYMVAESLKAYFKKHLSVIEDLDKKIYQLFSTGNEENPFDKSDSKKIVEVIESVRIVDPAVGSGAFPMGALNKLVFILNKVDPRNELWKQAQLSATNTIPDPRIKQDTKNRIEEFFKGKNADYGRKLYLIQKCIYGVDIQQIAVEIAKLRFFISLLVDEKIDKTKENWGIEALPNLDFKIMQGNSLISEFLGIDFDNGQEKQEVQSQDRLDFGNEDDSLIKEFERKKIDYQNESDKDKKTKLKDEVEDLMIQIFETKLRIQKEDYFHQIDDIEQKYSALPNKQEREETISKEKQRLSQKTGFDLENIEKQLREFISKKKVRPFFPWKLYFAEVFSEKEGFDIVIANPPYIEFKKLQASEKAKFKKYKSAKGKYDIYVIFDERSSLLLNSGGVLCLIQPTTFLKKDFGEQIRNFIRENFKIKTILDFADIQVFKEATNYTGVFIFEKEKHSTEYSFSYHQYFSSGNPISITDFQNSLNENYSSPIKNYLIVHESELKKKEWNFQNDTIKNLFEKLCLNTKPLSNFTESIFQGIASGKDEVFYVDEKIIKEYRIEKGILRKLIKGKDIKRYKIDWSGHYVIYPYDKDSKVLSETILKNDFPNAFNYFKNHQDLLKGRDYFDSSNKKWFELWNQRNVDNFRKNRIVCPEIADKNNFAFTDLFYGNTKTYHIIPLDKSEASYYFLLGILNSKLLDFIYKKIATPQAGGFFAYKTQFLSKLPIKITKDQKPFIKIVDKILAITKSSEYLKNPAKKEEVKEYEKQIDQMVYELYDLTSEEIEIVENSSKK